MAENTNKNTNETKDNKPKVDTKKREFLLNKNVSAETVQPIIQGINEINTFDAEQEAKDPDYIRKPIKIIVDSFGGSVYCGNALINTIDTSETPVHTYCYGKAMSMGFATFVAGHVRFAHKNATLMYHDASTTLGGTVEGIQQNLNQTKKIVKALDEMIVEYTNIPLSKLDKVKKQKQDWYMNGKEGLELGAVDVILESTRAKHRQK